MNSLQTAVLIPAYNPETLLCRLVQELSAEGFRRIVVVNDGSGESSAEVFRTLEADGLCTVISHAVNTGKGAALKLGLDYLYSRYPECRNIITADADGQHSPEDIRRLAEEAERHPDCLILGVRSFDRENVPFRSMIGNKTTRLLMRLFLGLAVSDTQTGLRSIPRRLIPDLLKIASNRYEFELEMLILCRRAGIPLREIGIRTIYIDGNSASHFNPLLDSFKIYFVLFRYILSSIVTAVFDFIVFLIVFPLTGGNVLVSTYLSRGAAVCLNYALVKNMVKFLVPYELRVNAVAPGFVDTEWQKTKPAEIRRNIENKVSLGRFCDPDELAEVYKMLIENSYFNGEVVVVDGGYSYK